MTEILEAAGWSNAKTFASYYQKPLAADTMGTSISCKRLQRTQSQTADRTLLNTQNLSNVSVEYSSSQCCKLLNKMLLFVVMLRRYGSLLIITEL